MYQDSHSHSSHEDHNFLQKQATKKQRRQITHDEKRHSLRGKQRELASYRAGRFVVSDKADNEVLTQGLCYKRDQFHLSAPCICSWTALFLLLSTRQASLSRVFSHHWSCLQFPDHDVGWREWRT